MLERQAYSAHSAYSGRGFRHGRNPGGRTPGYSYQLADCWRLEAGSWKLEAAASWKLVLLAGSWLWFDTPLVAGGRGGSPWASPIPPRQQEIGAG